MRLAGMRNDDRIAGFDDAFDFEVRAASKTFAHDLRREGFLTFEDPELFGVCTDASRIAAYPDGNVLRLVSFVYLVTAGDVSPLRASDESLDLRLFEVRDPARLDIVATAMPIMARYLSEKEY